MNQKKIIDYFPKKLTPRAVQTFALTEIEKAWKSNDILVVNLPVASGKSAISIAISYWAKRARIITPTRLLVDQYTNEYPIHAMRGKGEYYCKYKEKYLSQFKQTGKDPEHLCNQKLNCPGCNKYKSDLEKALTYPLVLSNYFVYMAYDLHQGADTLVVDEAHNLVPTLQEMHSKQIWQKELPFPDELQVCDLRQFFNDIPKSWFGKKYAAIKAKQRNGISAPHEIGLLERVNKYKEQLNSDRPTYMFRIEEDKFRGKLCKCIKMKPLDISKEPEILWPSTKKLVLLSATLSRKDIEQLGVFNKKICYIEADSPINAENRPVIIPPEAVSLSIKDQLQNVPKLVRFINKLAGELTEDKGLIHATYGLAEKIKTEIMLNYPELAKRVIFHNKKDKKEKYKLFREAETPCILVASGMYEGIDLPYEAGRWQVIAKVPYPSLGDPAIKYMANLDEEYYAWETIKVTLQACGRICRTPTDYGETFIFDSSFLRLYNNNINLFPKWFRNSVKIIK